MRKSVFSLFVVLLMGLTGCSLDGPSQTEPSSTSTPQIAVPSETYTPEAPYVPPEHTIQIQVVDVVGEFYNTQTDEVFIPRGVNYIKIVNSGEGYLENRVFEVGGYDHDVFAADMQALAERGYNTVRLFLECSSDATCITDPSTGRLNGP